MGSKDLTQRVEPFNNTRFKEGLRCQNIFFSRIHIIQ